LHTRCLRSVTHAVTFTFYGCYGYCTFRLRLHVYVVTFTFVAGYVYVRVCARWLLRLRYTFTFYHTLRLRLVTVWFTHTVTHVTHVYVVYVCTLRLDLRLFVTCTTYVYLFHTLVLAFTVTRYGCWFLHTLRFGWVYFTPHVTRCRCLHTVAYVATVTCGFVGSLHTRYGLVHVYWLVIATFVLTPHAVHVCSLRWLRLVVHARLVGSHVTRSRTGYVYGCYVYCVYTLVTVGCVYRFVGWLRSRLLLYVCRYRLHGYVAVILFYVGYRLPLPFTFTTTHVTGWLLRLHVWLRYARTYAAHVTFTHVWLRCRLVTPVYTARLPLRFTHTAFVTHTFDYTHTRLFVCYAPAHLRLPLRSLHTHTLVVYTLPLRFAVYGWILRVHTHGFRFPLRFGYGWLRYTHVRVYGCVTYRTHVYVYAFTHVVRLRTTRLHLRLHHVPTLRSRLLHVYYVAVPRWLVYVAVTLVTHVHTGLHTTRAVAFVTTTHTFTILQFVCGSRSGLPHVADVTHTHALHVWLRCTRGFYGCWFTVLYTAHRYVWLRLRTFTRWFTHTRLRLVTLLRLRVGLRLVCYVTTTLPLRLRSSPVGLRVYHTHTHTLRSHGLRLCHVTRLFTHHAYTVYHTHVYTRTHRLHVYVPVCTLPPVPFGYVLRVRWLVPFTVYVYVTVGSGYYVALRYGLFTFTLVCYHVYVTLVTFVYCCYTVVCSRCWLRLRFTLRLHVYGCLRSLRLRLIPVGYVYTRLRFRSRTVGTTHTHTRLPHAHVLRYVVGCLRLFCVTVVTVLVWFHYGWLRLRLRVYVLVPRLHTHGYTLFRLPRLPHLVYTLRF